MTKEEAAKELEEEFKIFLEGSGLDNEEHLEEEMKNNEDLRKVVEANRMAISTLTKEDDTMEWIPAKVGKLFPSNDYKCSKCGNILNFDGVNCGRGDANFCPNCGRKAVNK